MASVKELHKLVGQEARVTMLELSVPVEIVDIRERFGMLDYLVTPVGGEGERWFTEEKVAFEARTDE